MSDSTGRASGQGSGRKKPSRGILRVQDLHARSERRPGSSCWWWTGAASTHKGKCDGPRIWTLDYRRAEKRVMSGPAAVYHITHKAAPPEGMMAYMRCMNTMCVRPECVTAGTMQQLCRAMSAAGKYASSNTPGAKLVSMAKARLARGIKDTPVHVVHQVLAAPAGETTRSIAARLGLSPEVAGKIRRGKSRASVAGAHKEAA